MKMVSEKLSRIFIQIFLMSLILSMLFGVIMGGVVYLDGGLDRMETYGFCFFCEFNPVGMALFYFDIIFLPVFLTLLSLRGILHIMRRSSWGKES